MAFVNNNRNFVPYGTVDHSLRKKIMLATMIMESFGSLTQSLKHTPKLRGPVSDHSTHKYTRQQAKARKHKAQMVKESRRRNWG